MRYVADNYAVHFTKKIPLIIIESAHLLILVLRTQHDKFFTSHFPVKHFFQDALQQSESGWMQVCFTDYTS